MTHIQHSVLLIAHVKVKLFRLEGLFSSVEALVHNLAKRGSG